MEIKSILREILEDVKKITCVKKVKETTIFRINNSKIKEVDKKKMVKYVSSKRTYYEVVKCIYDLILKYEGDGVITESLNGGNLK